MDVDKFMMVNFLVLIYSNLLKTEQCEWAAFSSSNAGKIIMEQCESSLYGQWQTLGGEGLAPPPSNASPRYIEIMMH